MSITATADQGQRLNQRQMDEGDRLLREMLIILAYMFSALLDTFILDSMHFWTGESPIKASDVNSDRMSVTTLGKTTIRWTASEDGATVTYERDGLVERRATIVASATGYRLVEDNGYLLSEAEYAADGRVRLLDGACRVVKEWNEEWLKAIAGHDPEVFAEVRR